MTSGLQIAGDLPQAVLSGLMFWSHPLAEALEQEARSMGRTMLVAMAGPPNCAKGVYAEYVAQTLNEAGCPTVHIRFGDFKLSKHARERLAQSTHPLMSYPGQIGTHDTLEIERVLLSLRNGKLTQPLHVPVFDTALDVRSAFSKWLVIRKQPKVVIVSGWELGLVAQESSTLVEPVNDFERQHDPDGVWRTAVNKAISDGYQPLYGLFDRWVYRKPPSFADVRDWIKIDHDNWVRRLTEAGVELSEVQREIGDLFGDLCQRVCEGTIDRLAAKSDYLLTLNAHRKITSFARQRTD